MDEVGQRSFAPILIIPALIVITPLGAIPTLPTFAAAIVFLVASQMLLGLDHIWLPGFLEKRSIERKRLRLTIGKAVPVAKLIDKILKHRLAVLTKGPFLSLMLFLCVAAALVTPFLELVPLAAAVPNAAIVGFGLSIVARDGVLALCGMILIVGSFCLIFGAF